jgi:ERCC4-type nuclease
MAEQEVEAGEAGEASIVTTIVVDTREKDLRAAFEAAKIQVEIQQIPPGCGDIWIVSAGKLVRMYERKAFQDFISSLKSQDGRLFTQLSSAYEQIKSPEKIWYVLEGAEFLAPEGHTGKMSPNAIRGAIQYLDAVGVHRVHTSDPADTARLIAATVEKMRNGASLHAGVSLPTGKKVDSPFDIQRRMLSCIPRVSMKRAFTILDIYGGIAEFVIAAKKDKAGTIAAIAARGIGEANATAIITAIEPVKPPDPAVSAQINRIIGDLVADRSD